VTLETTLMINKSEGSGGGGDVVILIPLTPSLWHSCRLSSAYCFNTCSFPRSVCNRSRFSVIWLPCRDGAPTDKSSSSLCRNVQFKPVLYTQVTAVRSWTMFSSCSSLQNICLSVCYGLVENVNIKTTLS